MQTAGPYRLQRPLSTCDVGDVWSGVDSQGHSVTVAVLEDLALRLRPGLEVGPIRSDGSFSALARELADYMRRLSNP